MAKQLDLESLKNPHSTFKGYLFLLFGIVIFSGVLANADGWLSIFDYTVLSGKFSSNTEGAIYGLQGAGGSGAKEGFMFAFNILPCVALAMGIVSVIEGQGGLASAQRLLSPILKPTLGIPGVCGLAMITSFQLVDVAAVQVRELKDLNLITEDELAIFTTFLFSAGHLVNVYYTVGLVLFPYYPASIPVFVPLLVVFFSKVIGANLMRLYIWVERSTDSFRNCMFRGKASAHSPD